VSSILDLDDPDTHVFEAHYGVTQEWAAQLLALGKAPGQPVSFDRYTSAVEYTLGDVAAQAAGTSHESFHFVLNNAVVKDNRIPTWLMSYDRARERNALPEPPDQYGDPGPGGVYDHFAVVTLDPPPTAARGEIDLLYQPTSWEYIQFLYLANDGSNAFLGDEGENILEGWLHTDMAAPYTMASTSITVLPEPSTLISLAAGSAFLGVLSNRRSKAPGAR